MVLSTFQQPGSYWGQVLSIITRGSHTLHNFQMNEFFGYVVSDTVKTQGNSDNCLRSHSVSTQCRGQIIMYYWVDGGKVYIPVAHHSPVNTMRHWHAQLFTHFKPRIEPRCWEVGCKCVTHCATTTHGKMHVLTSIKVSMWSIKAWVRQIMNWFTQAMACDLKHTQVQLVQCNVKLCVAQNSQGANVKLTLSYVRTVRRIVYLVVTWGVTYTSQNLALGTPNWSTNSR